MNFWRRIFGGGSEAPGPSRLDYFNEALAGMSSLSALSPAVHALAAESARAAGDDADGELEEFLLAACLHAILETGDGTAEAPYLVVCTADERHVCQALDLEPGPQALINASGTSLDVVQCLDGTDVWFAVSHLAPMPEPQPLTRRAAKCASRPRRRLSQSRR